MESLSIRPCTVEQFAAANNLEELFAEYANESAIAGMGQCNVQMDIYRQMEAAGMLHPIAAYQGDEMVGFIALLISPVPHYGQLVGTTESFFVAKKARAGGTGIKLLRAAEDKARELGAAGVFVSAPVGSRLAAVMPHVGYRQTNEVFFRGFE